MYVNRQIANLLHAAVREHGRIDLPAHGASMSPFIRKGDLCAFAPCEAASLRPGDIVLFLSDEEQLVAHRLVAIELDAEGPLLVTKGDANAAADPPFREDRIIGKLVSARKRDGRVVTVERWSARAWSWGVRHIPAVASFARRFAANRRRAEAAPREARQRAAERGDAERGDAERGDAERGDAERGDAERGDAERRAARRGAPGWGAAGR